MNDFRVSFFPWELDLWFSGSKDFRLGTEQVCMGDGERRCRNFHGVAMAKGLENVFAISS